MTPYEQVKALVDTIAQRSCDHVKHGFFSSHAPNCHACKAQEILNLLPALKPPAQQPDPRKDCPWKCKPDATHCRCTAQQPEQVDDCIDAAINKAFESYKQYYDNALSTDWKWERHYYAFQRAVAPFINPQPTAQQPAQGAEDLLWLQTCLREHPGDKPSSVRAALAYIGERLAGSHPVAQGAEVEREHEYKPDLLPCPFCGGKAELFEPDGIWYAVRCPSCHIQGTGNRNQDYKAVQQWNTRAALSHPLTPAEPACAVALLRLVDLKAHKDKHGKDAHYEQEQPAAWRMAHEALNGAALTPADREEMVEAMRAKYDEVAFEDSEREAMEAALSALEAKGYVGRKG